VPKKVFKLQNYGFFSSGFAFASGFFSSGFAFASGLALIFASGFAFAFVFGAGVAGAGVAVFAGAAVFVFGLVALVFVFASSQARPNALKTNIPVNTNVFFILDILLSSQRLKFIFANCFFSNSRVPTN
jgi:hypothetical protein